jgi:hypothetical protein
VHGSVSFSAILKQHATDPPWQFNQPATIREHPARPASVKDVLVAIGGGAKLTTLTAEPRA